VSAVRLSLLTYRRTGSALHATRAGVAVAYLLAPCAVVLLFDHPAVLVGALGAVVGAGIGAGLASELARAARLALPLVGLITLVNPLVYHEGLTLLVAGPRVPVLGRLDITLEALAYGGVAGLRVMVVVLAFAIYAAAVDPDELLRLFRRLSFRSSLTASLATRLVPVLGRDAERLADAYDLRAERPAPANGRLARLRRAAILTRALAAGALERAVELAAALEVRGYGSSARPTRASPRVRTGGTRGRSPWSRHDRAFGASTLATLSLAVAGHLTGRAGFEPYPSLSAELGEADLGLALALAALLLAPFWARLPRLAARRRRTAALGSSPRTRSADA
jgi:energy-coupling factor transport system permease protein